MKTPPKKATPEETAYHYRRARNFVAQQEAERVRRQRRRRRLVSIMHTKRFGHRLLRHLVIRPREGSVSVEKFISVRARRFCSVSRDRYCGRICPSHPRRQERLTAPTAYVYRRERRNKGEEREGRTNEKAREGRTNEKARDGGTKEKARRANGRKSEMHERKKKRDERTREKERYVKEKERWKEEGNTLENFRQRAHMCKERSLLSLHELIDLEVSKMH